jgi:GLPGLI family protein
MLVGDNYSVFANIGDVKMDSAMVSYKRMDVGTAMKRMVRLRQKSRSDFLCGYKIYKNHKENTFQFLNDFGKKSSVKVEGSIKFNWKLERGDTTILNYMCNKATVNFGGRCFVAWYCVDMPIMAAPYKFHGLPGLVMSVYDTEKQHIFRITNISKLQYNKPIYKYVDDSYVKISAEKFVKSLYAYMAKLAKQASMGSGKHSLIDPEIRSKAILGAKNNRNFIERY